MESVGNLRRALQMHESSHRGRGWPTETIYCAPSKTQARGPMEPGAGGSVIPLSGGGPKLGGKSVLSSRGSGPSFPQEPLTQNMRL